MARTIQSPGVEIKEFDLSENPSPAIGTYTFTAGFADKGPTDEILQVTSVEEFEQIYGAPTTPAERYFYHSVTQQFNSQANVLVGRLPYGYENGEGFSVAKMYSVLAYPVQSVQSSKKGELVQLKSAGIAPNFYTINISAIDKTTVDLQYKVKLVHEKDAAAYKIETGTISVELSNYETDYTAYVTNITKDSTIAYTYYIDDNVLSDINDKIKNKIKDDKDSNYQKKYTKFDSIEIQKTVTDSYNNSFSYADTNKQTIYNNNATFTCDVECVSSYKEENQPEYTTVTEIKTVTLPISILNEDISFNYTHDINIKSTNLNNVSFSWVCEVSALDIKDTDNLNTLRNEFIAKLRELDEIKDYERLYVQDKDLPIKLSGSFTYNLEDENSDDEQPFTTLTSRITTVESVSSVIESKNKTKFNDGNLYVVHKPLHFELTEQQYLELQDGVKWEDNSGLFTDLEEIGKAGIIIVNKAQTTINDQYEGYYIGIADNMAMEPSSKYESLLSVQTVNGGTSFIEMPETRMNFTLSGDNSLSQAMEDSPSFSIYGSEFDDTLVVNVFKMRKSIYADSPLKLDANISESYTASVDYHRQLQSPTGGAATSFFIEKKAEDSTDIQIMVNPFMSGKKSGKTWIDENTGKPNKKIRVAFSPNNTEFSNDESLGEERFDIKYASQYGMVYDDIKVLGDEGDENADALYALGVYQAKNANTKVLGSIPNKLSRILSKIDNRDLFELDITVEAGLGTIWSYYKEAQYQWLNAENVTVEVEKLSSNMDEYATIDEKFEVPNAPYADAFITDEYSDGTKNPNYIEQFNQYKLKLTECNANPEYREFLAALACDFNDESDTVWNTANKGLWFKTGQDAFDGNGGEDAEMIINYRTINNTFINFAQNDRKDHMHICDPLRFIFLQGANKKTLSDKSKNFSQHIYWPLRYQFMTANTSYAATYGNWAKVYDAVSDDNIWIPMSGVLATVYANTDANFYCWYAPAGPDRGVLTTVSDIAFSPALKQRDQLYKISINPIYQDPNMGFVVFGQKTLQSKPSSFDRINVRRLFLYLEKSTYNTIKWFLFRNNTYSTRTAIINTLDPIFRSVLNNEGMYDYRIVCNENNNTPDVIDANELVVDIYIKAARTAEFILCNFYSTKTSTNFDELIK